MTEELKQKAESNYRKHSEKLDKLCNGALYSEGALFGYNEAKKGFKEEIEYAEKHCLFSDCVQIENLKKAKEIIEALYHSLKKFNKVILYRPKEELLNAIQKAEEFLKE